MLETQQRLSRIPTPRHAAGRELPRRARASTCSSIRSPAATCTWGWRACSPGAWRATGPNTFSISVNDYGFELVSAEPFDLDAGRRTARSSRPRDLLHDVLASLNSSELAQRRFREIARVAGLIFTGYPGQPKSTRQLQASSALFYEVFRKYDADNLLLTQAEQEVLSQELEISRLRGTLERMQRAASTSSSCGTPAR